MTPSPRSGPRALRCAAVAVALLASCSSAYRARDWSRYEGPGAQYFQQEELPFPHVDDPLEPVNRVTSAVDYGFIRYLVAPAAAIYRYFVPQDVRQCLSRASLNIRYPVRLVNNLLQAKWSEATEETSRFLLNSTVGVLGMFDPAAKMGLDPHPEDFGETFARWGWKNSTYFYLPLFGPSTVRDGVGEIPNWYTDPGNLSWQVGLARGFIKVTDSVDHTVRLVESYYDAYEPTRTVYTIQREADVANLPWRRDDSSATQTLESMFLKPENDRFADLSATDRVPLAKHRDLEFTAWLQPEPAPLVYLVPGFGGHRLGDSTLGLAELFYAQGSSVVAVSNPTNWEFILHASTVDLPGYTPVDARDLHAAITAIDRRLEARLPGRFTSKRLAGISMGAFQTLYIAADEARSAPQGLLAFDAYVALDPPVDLEHAMSQLDHFYNVPLEFPVDQRARRIEEIFGKVLVLSHGEIWPGMELPFTKEEAQFLIGLSFRQDLQFTILASQDRHDQGVLRTPRGKLRRAPAFREISEYSFLEYMYAFVLPYYARRDPRISFDEAGARTMFADCDLRSIESALESNDRVRVFVNENDFVLRPEDLAWLRDHLGDRAKVFPAGGHLGNLHRKAIQEAIRSTVEEAASNGHP